MKTVLLRILALTLCLMLLSPAALAEDKATAIAALIARSKEFSAKGDYYHAGLALDVASDIDPENESMMLALADLMLLQGEAEKAYDCCLEIVSKHPACRDAYERMCSIDLEHYENAQDALSNYSLFYVCGGENPALACKLASMLYKEGSADNALFVLENYCVQQDPQASALLAVELFKAGFTQGAYHAMNAAGESAMLACKEAKDVYPAMLLHAGRFSDAQRLGYYKPAKENTELQQAVSRGAAFTLTEYAMPLRDLRLCVPDYMYDYALSMIDEFDATSQAIFLQMVKNGSLYKSTLTIGELEEMFDEDVGMSNYAFIDASPDGKNVLLVDGACLYLWQEDRLIMLYADGMNVPDENAEKYLRSAFSNPYRFNFTWSPDGRYAAATASGRSFLVDVESCCLILPDTQRAMSAVCFDRTGEHLYMMMNDQSKLLRYVLATGQVEEIMETDHRLYLKQLFLTEADGLLALTQENLLTLYPQLQAEHVQPFPRTSGSSVMDYHSRSGRGVLLLNRTVRYTNENEKTAVKYVSSLSLFSASSQSVVREKRVALFMENDRLVARTVEPEQFEVWKDAVADRYISGISLSPDGSCVLLAVGDSADSLSRLGQLYILRTDTLELTPVNSDWRLLVDPYPFHTIEWISNELIYVYAYPPEHYTGTRNFYYPAGTLFRLSYQ